MRLRWIDVTDQPQEWPDNFDAAFPIGTDDGDRAYFGRDVLRGLTEGIDEFRSEAQQRWQRPRYGSGGIGLLGSAMWIDDPEVLRKLTELTAACVVVTKQGKKPRALEKLRPLQDLNANTPGLPIASFPGLSGIAPQVGGKPTIIGPYDSMEYSIPTIRTVGYRRGIGLPPIIHAKLALLGRFWWSDDHPSGYPMEFTGFTAQRLWVSSANFTEASRRSLEFGYWTEDPKLMAGARRFLEAAIRSSEDVDPDADEPDPEFLPVEFDDQAMAEAAAGMAEAEAGTRWLEEDDEDPDL